MEENNKNEVLEDQSQGDNLISAIASMAIGEYSRLQDFINLTQQLKAKQEALDIMASEPTTSAIGESYVSDTLEPNSQGDLVTLIAKTPGEQIIIDNIYKRLNLPLDKITYSLFKNGIAIVEFAHESDLREYQISDKAQRLKDIKSKAVNEAIGSKRPEVKAAKEDILVNLKQSRIIPKVKFISDTTRVFPILQYEDVVGFVEITLSDYDNFDFETGVISYKDVVIHSAEDYSYKIIGNRASSKPIQLKVKLEDGAIVTYDIDQGRSLVEMAYPAWQTLSIIRDSVNLARLAYSAQAVVVQTEIGNASEAQIELARNKLKDLFENRLTFGKNGAKSYLQPQIKPNYIYSFTNNGKGAITTTTLGGDYNPGVLSDLRYFEDEFFGAIGAVKQHYARTEDGAGLDGGGAVEQYEKRYRSNVFKFKRVVGDFIKDCINKVLLSRGLRGVYNNFEVKVNRAYEEDDMQVVNHQSTKLSFLQSAIEFMGIKDPKVINELKLQAIKSIITDKDLIETFSKAMLEGKALEGNGDSNDGEQGLEGEMEGDLGLGGSSGDIMDEVDKIGTNEDPNLENEELSNLGDESELDQINNNDLEGTPNEDEGELPPISDVVDESQIDET